MKRVAAAFQSSWSGLIRAEWMQSQVPQTLCLKNSYWGTFSLDELPCRRSGRRRRGDDAEAASGSGYPGLVQVVGAVAAVWWNVRDSHGSGMVHSDTLIQAWFRGGEGVVDRPL